MQVSDWEFTIEERSHKSLYFFNLDLDGSGDGHVRMLAQGRVCQALTVAAVDERRTL